ncbi:hypothetical protein F8388_004958 [Cannabis sativa]|uniref:Homeobox domain-containing protein n=1 Tax=Cannabis sativa TaxID=3483 RepID=A0A7J6HRR1_CANSA|nr:hypothetical protein F8388_004958 [Cannabis sativa]
MATYFHGNSDIQAPDGGLQTLVLMNPGGYIPYSDTPPPPSATGNLIFLNSAANSLTQHHPNISHAPQSHQQTTQQFVTAIPSPHHHHHHHQQDPNNSQQPMQQQTQQHDFSALHGFMPRVQYNLWNSPDQSAAARETPRSQQQGGLSLTLSSQQLGGFGSFRSDREIPSPVQTQGQGPAVSGEDMRVSGGSSSSVSVVTNGVPGIQSVLLSSKYLKAAQELLDEVVNVGNEMRNEPFSKKGTNSSQQSKPAGESSAAASGDGSPIAAGETSGKRASELTPAERQEIQMKKAKLITMLDEVEQRYRQYHHQMQIVISSFEQAAGIGSARTYTALALQTISKQFRCLKDAITGQIRAANKSLGEEDCLNGAGKIEGSRLKYVDHHLRQQRALQQLGMIQQNAWRPQRGLPERSVSVLRAWLFEHFLHPYPKDSDKHMLAKQTGLTRSQVSNWFINARVRLWKPMVEEMYLEEIKEHEKNGSAEKNSKSNEDSDSKSTTPKEKSPAVDNQTGSFNSKQENSIAQFVPSAISMSTSSTSPTGINNHRNHSGFSLIGSSELDGITQGSPKKQRNTETLPSPNSYPSINMDVKPGKITNEQISMKFGEDQRQSRDGYSFMGNQTNFIGGFGQYPIAEIGRFDAEQFAPRYSGNGVSLTLGLPHCENLSLAGAHQAFVPNQGIQLGRRVDIGEQNEFGAMNSPTPHSSAAFENINIQNPKRFAAQLLPDYVA